MGTKRVARLRERFEREGCLELRLHPVKVAVHVTFFFAFGLGIPVLAWTEGGFVIVLAALFVPWFLLTVGFAYAEQFFGAGPPLRIDRRGLSLRRWREPLVLEWSDVSLLLPYRQSKLVGPMVAIPLSEWVWRDYRAGRPMRLRWVDTLTHFRNRFLVLLKVFDASAADILALVDADTVNRLTQVRPPYRLVLDLAEDGDSPLCLRGGRGAPLSELPLLPATHTAVTDWNSRVVGLLERDADDDDLTRAARAMAEEGRSLATHLQSELGPGAQVLFAGDVPLWASRDLATKA